MGRFLPVGKSLEEKFCCSKSTAWRISRSPGFPQPRQIRLENGSVLKGYWEADLDDYISSLPFVGSDEQEAAK